MRGNRARSERTAIDRFGWNRRGGGLQSLYDPDSSGRLPPADGRPSDAVVLTPNTLEHLLSLGILTALTAGVAVALRFFFALDSPRGAFVGWYVAGWAVGGCFVWGVTEVALTGGSIHTPTAAFAGIGFGVVVGFIVGRLAWWQRHRPTQEGDE